MDSKSVCAALAVAFALAAAPMLASAQGVCPPPPPGPAPTTTAGPPPIPPQISAVCLTGPNEIHLAPCDRYADAIIAWHKELAAWTKVLNGFPAALKQWHAQADAYYTCETARITVKYAD